MILQFVLGLLFYAETKGRSLEQIQQSSFRHSWALTKER